MGMGILLGGFVAEYVSFSAAFWITAIMQGAGTLLSLYSQKHSSPAADSRNDNWNEIEWFIMHAQDSRVQNIYLYIFRYNRWERGRITLRLRNNITELLMKKIFPISMPTPKARP